MGNTMTMRVTSLASGSSGNALLIQADGAALLIDCGLPQRVIERHLGHAGLRPGDLTAILLTHEHGDHVLSAGPLARRHSIPIVANAAAAAAMGMALSGVERLDLVVGGTIALGPFGVRSFAVPHDAAAPVGYAIEAHG